MEIQSGRRRLPELVPASQLNEPVIAPANQQLRIEHRDPLGEMLQNILEGQKSRKAANRIAEHHGPRELFTVVCL